MVIAHEKYFLQSEMRSYTPEILNCKPPIGVFSIVFSLEIKQKKTNNLKVHL